MMYAKEAHKSLCCMLASALTVSVGSACLYVVICMHVKRYT